MNSILGAAILLWPTLAQEDTARQAKELIEHLRSERIEDREDATRKLKDLGRAAVPELQRASKDADREVAERASSLLRVILVQETLTPRLIQTIPGIVDRLAQGKGHPWAAVFLQAVDDQAERLRYPLLGREDLACLAARALEEAPYAMDQCKILDVLGQRKIRSCQDQVVKLLSHKNELVRMSAVSALRELRYRECIPALRALLGDENDLVRADVFTTFAEFGVQDAAPQMVQGLRGSASELVASSASSCLNLLRPKEAIPLILALLEDGAPTVRERALSALSWARTPEVISKVTLLLKDKNASVRGEAAMTLGRLGARERLGDLLTLSADEEKEARLGALVGIAHLRCKDAIPKLILLLKDQDSDIRGAAVGAVGSLRSKETIPALIPLLGDTDSQVRTLAMRAIRETGAPDAVAPLLKILEDTHDDERGTAAYSLAQLGQKRLIPKIMRILDESKKPDVCEMAILALNVLDAKEAIPRIQSFLGRSESGVRGEALDALGDLGATEATASIADLLADKSHYVRACAAEALCKLGRKEGFLFLLEEERYLISLNAFRSPQAFRRLNRTRLDHDLTGTRKELLKEVSRLVGLRLECPQSEAIRAWLEEDLVVETQTRLLVALDLVTSRRYQAILENDRILILPRDEAIKSWNDWWKAEGVNK